MKFSASVLLLTQLVLIVSCSTSQNQPRGSNLSRSPVNPADVPTNITSAQTGDLSRERPVYRSVQDPPEMGRFYLQARKTYDHGDSKAALPQIAQYYKTNENGQFTDEAAFLLAKQAWDASNFEGASAYYQRLIQMEPASRLRGDSIYLNAICLNNLGRKKEALSFLARVELREVSAQNRTKLFKLWGSLASDEGKWLESALALVKARRESVSPEEQTTLGAMVEDQVENRLGEAELNFVLQEYPTEFPNNAIRMRLVTLRLAAGQRSEANTLLQQVILESTPGSPLHTRASQYAARLAKLGNAETSRIGVLLPLSGRQEPIGRAVLNGLEMSLMDPPNSAKGLNLQIVKADSGPTPETALQAFERLVFEDRVMAVVGPPSGSQAEVVADKAVELGVPNIALAARPGLIEKGASIFRLALTPERQVRALVGYAKERLGALRYAILFPEDSFGREFAVEYMKAVQDFGGEVTAAESYSPEQSDFRVQIENLVGKGFAGFRKAEFDSRMKLLEEKLGRKPRNKEAEQASLSPIVDFDVLFIPDSFRAVGQIVPALLYADVSSPQLMGPSTWNNRNLLRRAGNYMEKAIFVDSFSIERARPVTKSFVEKFQVKYGAVPSALSAQGYDVGLALRQAYARGGTPPESRDELRSRLETLGTLEGALGVHTWNSRREALGELQLFQIRRGNFIHQGGIALKPRAD